MMAFPQRLDPMIRERNKADLGVRLASYFGEEPGTIDNLARWSLDGRGSVVRRSYVFQAVYKRGENDYGGIQIRARIHSYGTVPDEYDALLQETAHRAAHMYNSSIETPAYVNQTKSKGTVRGSGYLDGFNPVGVYKNWERQEIPSEKADTPAGVVDWSVEVYEEDTFDHADLAGIAQGLSFPWYVDVERQPPVPAESVAPHKWDISFNDSRGQYDIHPQGRTSSRERYQPGGAGHNKTVYINNRPVGSLDDRGRTWLATEYQGDPRKTNSPHGTYWSREGLVQATGATYSALRRGGTLYLTGETENAIHLKTAREKPEGYEAADPDNVSARLQVSPGKAAKEIRRLRLRDLSNEIEIEARRDEAITWAMGFSEPIYSHWLGKRQRWEPRMEGDPNHPSWGGKGGNK